MSGFVTKRNVIILALAGAIVTLVASGRTWVKGSLNDGVLASMPVSVSGNTAVPGFFGLAIVAGAGVLAAATAGRIVRWPAAVVGLVASIAEVGLLAYTLADTDRPVHDQMAKVTGHTGEAVVRSNLEWWFWVAMFGALVALMASALCLGGLKRWASLSSKYDAPATKRAEGTRTDWDLMNDGIDPTSDEMVEQRAESAQGSSRHAANSEPDAARAEEA